MDDLDKALLGVVTTLEDERIAEGVEPHNALYREVQAQVNASLNRLYKDGKIHVGRTLNGTYIATLREQDNANEEKAAGDKQTRRTAPKESI